MVYRFEREAEQWKYDDEEWDEWFVKYGYKDVENYEAFLPPAGQVLSRVRRQTGPTPKDFDPKEVIQAYRENITPLMLTTCIIFWLTCIVLPLLFCSEFLCCPTDYRSVAPEENEKDEEDIIVDKDEERGPEDVEYISQVHQSTQIAYEDGEDIYQDIRPDEVLLIVLSRPVRYSQDRGQVPQDEFVIHQKPSRIPVYELRKSDPINPAIVRVPTVLRLPGKNYDNPEQTGLEYPKSVTTIRRANPPKYNSKLLLKSDPSKVYAAAEGQVVRRKPEKVPSSNSHIATQTSKDKLNNQEPAEKPDDDNVWHNDYENEEELGDEDLITATSNPALTTEDNSSAPTTLTSAPPTLIVTNATPTITSDNDTKNDADKGNRSSEQSRRSYDLQSKPGPSQAMKEIAPTPSSKRNSEKPKKKCEGKVLVGQSSRFLSAECQKTPDKRTFKEVCACADNFVTKKIADLSWLQLLEYMQAEGSWDNEKDSGNEQSDTRQGNKKDKKDCKKKE